MFMSKLEKRGNEYVITVPKDEVERLGLTNGVHVTADLVKSDEEPSDVAGIQDVIDIELKSNREALKYLKDH